jgi:hypothetical protein
VDAGEQALELVNPEQPDIRLRARVWAGQLADRTRLRVEGEQLSSHAVYYQRAASADPKSRLIELRLKPEAGTFIIGSPVRVALRWGAAHHAAAARCPGARHRGAWSIRWSSAARR